MKLFLWRNIDKLTDNYHSDGGLVVIAESLQKAMELATEKGVEFQGEIPNRVVELSNNEKSEVFIFPDAGCC